MKKILLAAVAMLAISAGTETFAQDVAVTIGPEQRTVIREYVVKRKIRPATISGQISVGAVVPADVDLVAVPADWGPEITRYRYVYHNNRVVLVEPQSRKVVHIID
jgi:hypothetical protein